MTLESPEPKPQKLSVVAGRGLFWMFSSSAIGKFLAVINQVVLGWFLSAQDFGLFALSIGFATIFTILVNGGIQHILVRRGAERYDALAPSAFWFAMAFNGAAALAVLALIPVAMWLYGEPDLQPVLAVLALGVFLAAPSIMFQTRLQVTMRFRDLAKVIACSALAWSLTVCTFAYAGAGAVTFACGNVAMAVSEALVGWWLTREAIHRWRPDTSHWHTFWRDSAWLNGGNMCNALAMRGDYLVLGLFIPTASVGLYMFAFNLAGQFTQLLTQQINRVVVPVMQRFADQPARLAAATERFLPAMTAIAAVPSLGLGLVIVPLEQLIWHGKWEAAVPATMVFCAIAPLRHMSAMAHSLMYAKGWFRLRAGVFAFQAGVVVGAAALGAWLFGNDIVAIALTAGIAQIIGNQLVLQYVMPQPTRVMVRVVGKCLRAYAICLVAAIATAVLTRSWLPADAHGLTILVSGALYGLLVVALMRLFVPDQICEARDILPASLARLMSRLFFLPLPTAPQERT